MSKKELFAGRNGLLWVIAILALLLIALLFTRVQFNLRIEDARKAPTSTSEPQAACPDIGERPVLAQATISIGNANKDCLIRTVNRAYLIVNEADRYDLVKYLSEILNGYYSNRTPTLFDDTYTRFTALNLVVPYAVGRQLTLNVGAIQNDLRKELKTANSPTRAMAITVLSYFKDDADLVLFENAIKNADDEVIVASLVAVTHSCSSTAKVVLKRMMNMPEVHSYLARYREKETLTRFIRSDCPT